MISKFESYDCWKHDNCIDVFFCVSSVVQDTGKAAILLGYWMTQGQEHYWCCSDLDRIRVAPEQYKFWQKYEPGGAGLGYA